MSDMQTRAPKTNRPSAPAPEQEPAASTLRTEIPASVFDLFEKSVARAKDAHGKMSSIVEHSAEAFEEAFSCANRGAVEYRSKLMDIARTNADAAFDLARELIQSKSLTDVLESAMSHQRKLLELTAAQMKELSALTEKVVSETAEPIRNGMTEPFRMAS